MKLKEVSVLFYDSFNVFFLYIIYCVRVCCKIIIGYLIAYVQKEKKIKFKEEKERERERGKIEVM